MCSPHLPKTGLQVPVNYEYRDLNKDNKGTGVQLASSIDRRTGMRFVLNDEGHAMRGFKGTGAQLVDDDAGHNLPGLRGTGAQSISTNEGRDLGNTRGTGVQIASGRK